MRGKTVKQIMRAAEAKTIGKPLVATKRLYRRMKKDYLIEKRYNLK
jgi:hypothetical protein